MALSEWFVFFRRISSRKTGSSKNIVSNLSAQQQIALSSLSEDDGSVAKENWLYTLMFDDDRYLPLKVLEPFQHGHWNSQISR
ncbi:hypothetical protein [Xenorhabdus bovienii]|uniref:hypothetical protein n=1 Tax=Xenorhabdus bovienii TaxID=40576 RepID=UPI0023B252BA|nr:hypothetical protein [Xenorhabdus bovienii]MDE9462833.1 hypothetical protein [Xenorhabdus bovienii]MDE9470701.1 hypothetical protein [Xenorhabdus bovienii]